MRALAMTGIETASMIESIMSGSLIRETPPAARMSAGTRSSAITATAPASSAIFAWSAVTTSMMTPPLSIWARPFLVAHVEVSAVMLGLGSGLRAWSPAVLAPGSSPVRAGRAASRARIIARHVEPALQAHAPVSRARTYGDVPRAIGTIGQWRERSDPAIVGDNLPQLAAGAFRDESNSNADPRPDRRRCRRSAALSRLGAATRPNGGASRKRSPDRGPAVRCCRHDRRRARDRGPERAAGPRRWHDADRLDAAIGA